jgi:predicted lipoprotein with Yx(FWY)xxD motif
MHLVPEHDLSNQAAEERADHADDDRRQAADRLSPGRDQARDETGKETEDEEREDPHTAIGSRKPDLANPPYGPGVSTSRIIRRAVLLGVAATLAGALVATAATTATVKAAQNTTYGSLLVNSSGLTLYHLTSETKGAIKCTGACATLWPPLLVAGGATPSAGAGVTAAKLGTIKRPGGQIQVTYNGLPLYRYAPDKKSGQVLGEGVGGVWFAVSSAGKIVKHAPAATTTTTPASGGYGY